MSLLCEKCRKNFIDICSLTSQKGKIFIKAQCKCGMFIYKGELVSFLNKKEKTNQRYTIRYRKNIHNDNIKQDNLDNECQFTKEELKQYQHRLMDFLDELYNEYIKKGIKNQQLIKEISQKYNTIVEQNTLLSDFLILLYDNYIQSKFTKRSYLNYFSFNVFNQYSPRQFTPNYICSQIDISNQLALTKKINVLSITFNSYYNYLIYYMNASYIHIIDMTRKKNIFKYKIPFLSSSHFINILHDKHLLYSKDDYKTFYIININSLSVNAITSLIEKQFQSLSLLKVEENICTLAFSYKNANTDIYLFDISSNTMMKIKTINISFNIMIELSYPLFIFATELSLIAYDSIKEKCISKYETKETIRLLTSINESTFALTTRNDKFHIFTYKDNIQCIYTRDFYRTYITNVEGSIQSLHYSNYTLYLGSYDFIYLFDFPTLTFTLTITQNKFCPSFISSYHSSSLISLIIARCEDNCEILSIEY